MCETKPPFTAVSALRFAVVPVLCSCLTAVLVTGTLPGRAAAAASPDQRIGPGTRDQDIGKKTDANQISMFLTNFGSYAYDLSTGSAGLEFPQGSGKHAVFAAGLWLGATVAGQTRVTVAEYSTEYAGGRIEPGGTWDQNWQNNPRWRVYKISRGDTPQSNPDYAEWPVADGAPVDAHGNPLELGEQTCWTVFHDADPSLHTNRAGASAPLGVEVQLTAFARGETEALRNTVFLQWKIINKESNQLESVYVSGWMDPDLGGATDDLLGCDPSRSLGYVYNGNNSDPQYYMRPPALGLELLQGPIVPSPGDTAWVSGRVIPGYRNLPATAFVSFTNGTDPVSRLESYNYMRGLNADGSQMIDPTTGQPTPFVFNGDPVTGSGWVDGFPADHRMMLSAGPFTMAPGDTQTVAFAVEAGQGADRLASITRLRSVSALAQPAFRAILGNQPGACCLESGLCLMTQESLCSGVFFPAMTCSPAPCGAREGACCVANGTCIVVPPGDCPDDYLGDGTLCDPMPCTIPEVGACCVDYQCIITTEADCAGVFQGVGTRCESGTCQPIVWDWRPQPRWLDAVNAGMSTFYGGVGLGSEFFGSNLSRDEVDDVEIRIEANESAWSQCATFRRDQGYNFGGTGTFPGSVWDMADPLHPRQVNVCYVEWNTPEKPANLRWDPDGSDLGGREYFFIMKSDYDGGVHYRQGRPDLESDVMYAGWTRVRNGHQFLESTPVSWRFFLQTDQHAVGACCTPVGECLITERADCQGQYIGDGVVCEPLPCSPTAVEPIDRAGTGLPLLYGPVPNPTSGNALLRVDLPAPARLSVAIYTVQGALVRSLIDGTMDAGSRIVSWDGCDERGNPVARGTYFARMSAGTVKASRAIIVIR